MVEAELEREGGIPVVRVLVSSVASSSGACRGAGGARMRFAEGLISPVVAMELLAVYHLGKSL